MDAKGGLRDVGDVMEEIGGKWNTFTGTCRTVDKIDSIEFLFYPKDFEKDDELFIDNIRVYCLDDLMK